jgi:hypothetical protein
MILPRPSISPLHSFASTPTVRRSPSTMEMARAVWSWLTGRRRQSLKHRFREAREVERLAELDLDSPDADSPGQSPTSAPPRRWRAW